MLFLLFQNNKQCDLKIHKKHHYNNIIITIYQKIKFLDFSGSSFILLFNFPNKGLLELV